MKNQERALAKFLDAVITSREALDEIQTLLDDHFNADPDNVTWGDVAKAQRVAVGLAEITDFLFNREE